MVMEKFGLGEPLVDPADADLDIVFVHGLGGDRVKTWTWTGPESESCYWPKELLYKDCPTARVLSFGYNANFAHFYSLWGSKFIAGELNIDDHSTALFQALVGLREKSGNTERPLIFVAHSLGGLVVANALSRSQGTEPGQKKLIEHTIGTLFIGTPFDGSNKAVWASRGLNFIKLVGSTVQQQSVHDLEERSYMLMNIDKTFQKFLKNRDRSDNHVEVACFFEEYKMKVAGVKLLIVPKESASLPGIDPIPISENHSDMCKFEDEDRAGYKDISAKLKSWIPCGGERHRSDRNPGTAVSMGNVEYKGNISGNRGVIMGNAHGATKDSVRIVGSSITNNNYSGNPSKGTNDL